MTDKLDITAIALGIAYIIIDNANANDDVFMGIGFFLYGCLSFVSHFKNKKKNPNADVSTC